MPYTLEVVFRGLMVFVPSDGLSNPQPWFGAFLVNADLETLTGLGNDRTLKLHFPFIRYKVADLKGGPAGVESDALWELEGDDVVIRPASSPGGPLTISHSPTGSVGTQPATDAERIFFDWVPKVGDLLGDGAIHPDCLKAQPTKNLAVARIHLFEGTVGVKELTSFNEGDVVMEFSPLIGGGVAVRRTTATSVAVRMEGLEGDLTLRARKFDGSQTRELVFAEPAGGTLSLEVLNLCSDELLGQPPQFPGVDDDFVWNYLVTNAGSQRLLDNAPLSLPVAVQFSLNSGGGGGGEFAHCTHPQASPASAVGLATMLSVSDF